MTRRRKWTLRLLLLGGLGVVSFAIALRSSEVQHSLVTWCLSQVSAGIAGNITVGSGARIDGAHVVARDLRITDERGDEVIFAEQAEVSIDLLALLGAEIRMTSARGRGGRVNILERGDGSFGVDSAFQGTGEGGLSFTVAFDDIEVEDVTLRIEMQGGPRARVSSVAGHVSVHAGNGPTEVSFWDTHGHASMLDPIATEATVESARGVYRQGAPTRFDAQVDGEFMGEDLSAHLVLRPDEDGELSMHVDTHATGFFGALAGIGIAIGEGL